eukprot:CAMPEP_0169340814 /NCGR_PEP_ID=MMETSP1017-20121227/19157_1 /TAXON_ID=342587 /ORGANISM="Karlodinium micrum, Strain CCMP2283" /LENGTH=1012 /DNA_ID=CAMNT_0009436455 /DNA_START=67 /DNA_END=3106 /DNA_ORIENTATION=-
MTGCIETAAVFAIASGATCTLGLAGYSHVRLLRDAATNAEGGPLSDSPIASLRERGPLKAADVQLCLNTNSHGKVALEFNGEILHYTKNDRKSPAVALGGMDVTQDGAIVEARAKEDPAPRHVKLEFPSEAEAKKWADGLQEASQRNAAHIRIQEFIEYVLELEKYIKALKDRAKKVKHLEHEAEELKEKLKKVEDESPKKEKKSRPPVAHEQEEDEASGVDKEDLPARAKDLEEKAMILEKNLAAYSETIEKRTIETSQDSKKVLAENEKLSSALSQAEKEVAEANEKARELERRVMQLETGVADVKVQELQAAASMLDQRTKELEKLKSTSREETSEGCLEEASKLEAMLKEADMEFSNYIARLGQISPQSQQDTTVVSPYVVPSDPALEAKLQQSEADRMKLQEEVLFLARQLEQAQSAPVQPQVVQDTVALEALRSELALLQGEKEQALMMVKQLQQELQSCSSRAYQEQDIAEMKRRFEDQLAASEANSVSVQQYEQDIAKEIEKRALIEQAMVQNQAEAQQLARDNEQRKLEIQSLEKALAEKSAVSPSQDPRMKMYQQEAAEAKAAAADAAAAATKAEGKLSVLEDERLKQNQIIMQLESELNRVSADLGEARRVARNAPNEDEVNMIRKDFEKKLQAAKDKENEMMQVFEKDFLDLRRQVQEEKNRADQEAATSKFVQQEKSTLQLQLEQLAQSQRLSSSAQNELLQAQEDIRKYQKGQAQDRQTIEMLENALRDNTSNQANALQSAQAKSENLQQQVLQLSAERQQLEAETKFLMKEMQKMEQVRSVEPNPAQQQLLNDLSAENVELKNQLSVQQASRNRVGSEIVSSLTAENDELKSQLGELWKRIEEQTKKIEAEREGFWKELEAVREARAPPANITMPGQTTTTSTMGSMGSPLIRGTNTLPATREVRYPGKAQQPVFSTSTATRPTVGAVRGDVPFARTTAEPYVAVDGIPVQAQGRLLPGREAMARKGSVLAAQGLSANELRTSLLNLFHCSVFDFVV